MIYYKELRLNFNPFDGLPSHYYASKTKFPLVDKFIDPADLNLETLTWFSENNLVPSNCIFFAYQPKLVGLIHSDGFTCSNQDNRPFSAINFYQNGRGSIEWFTTKKSADTIVKETDLSKATYIKYKPDEVNIASSYNGTNPILVDTETPHRGVNHSDEMRYTITLRWRPVLTFQQALEKFEKYIL